MPTVLDWNPSVDPDDLVRVVRDSLVAGSAVVLPGDCGYTVVVNPALPQTLDLLHAITTATNTRAALLAWTADDARLFGLPVPLSAQRLTNRAWPGPLLIALPGTPTWPAEWPPGVGEYLTRGTNTLRLRCPEHALFEAIIPKLGLPALVLDTFLPTVESVLDLLTDPDALAISVGAEPGGCQPTVVRCEEAGFVIEEPGLFSQDEVEKFAARLVLFVCTGNTCRSPLAESLAKKLLTARLGCSVGELPRRGVWIMSAGVATYGGSPASEESVAVATELGASLEHHRSRSVNPQVLAAADDIIAMTHGHVVLLAERFPGVGPTPRLLCGSDDLDDPIGAGLDVYRECARTIETHLERFLPEWVGQ